MPSIPGFDADEPIATEPVEGIDLSTYAAISADLVEQPEARLLVLRACGLTERQWHRVEHTWLLRIAAAALRRDLSLSAVYDEAFTRAQAAFGPTEPTHSLSDYAGLVARLSSGQAASVVFADA